MGRCSLWRIGDLQRALTDDTIAGDLPTVRCPGERGAFNEWITPRGIVRPRRIGDGFVAGGAVTRHVANPDRARIVVDRREASGFAIVHRLMEQATRACRLSARVLHCERLDRLEGAAQ